MSEQAESASVSNSYQTTSMDESPNAIIPQITLATTQKQRARRQSEIDSLEHDLDRNRKALGHEDFGTFMALKKLATAYSTSHRYDEAIVVFDEMVKRMRWTKKSSGARYIAASNELDRLRDHVAQAQMALEQHQSILDASQRPYTRRDEHMARNLYRQGECLLTLGNPKAAIESLTDALLIMEPTVGYISSLHSITTMNKLAESYDELGATVEALELRRDILTVVQTKFGHQPITFAAMYNLAVSWDSLERWEDAIATSTELVQTCQKLHGATHSSTLRSKALLAMVLTDAGRVNDAVIMQRDLLKELRQFPGLEHPNVFQEAANLGRNYLLLKRAHHVRALNDEMRVVRELRNVDPSGTFTAVFMASYMAFDSNRDKVKEMKIMKKRLDENHPEIMKAQIRLAISYRDVGNFGGVGELIEKLDSGIEPQLEGYVIPKMNVMADAEDLNDIGESIRQSHKLLMIARQILGDEAPEVLAEIRNLAMFYRFAGYREEALQLLDNVLHVRRNAEGNEHSAVLEALHDIAEIYSDLGWKSRLLTIREKLLKMTRSQYGDEAPNTLEAMERLAVSYADSGRRHEAMALMTTIVAARRKPFKLRVPREQGRKCDFCHNLKPSSPSELQYGKIDLTKERPSSFDCATCPIIEQALLYLNPDWNEGKRYDTIRFELMSTSQSLLLSESQIEAFGPGSAVELFVKNGQPVPWNELGTWRQMRAEAGVNGRLARAKEWIRQCSTEHKTNDSCARDRARSLPKRVIDLRQFRKQKRLFLRQTADEYGRYACLSYCWGQDVLLCLTEENMQQMFNDIPFDLLPQTHKDAILVASTLGIPFLWIDALCIIQNDKNSQDWVEQSADMNRIYGNAYLCIAAANARSATEGFLSQRRPFAAPQVFRGESLVVYGRESFDHLPFICDANIDHGDNPLRERGWCFQEHFLSRRILHFGYEEMFFECKGATSCECGVFPGPLQPELPATAYLALRIMMATIQKNTLNQGWMKFVEEYARRSLTNPTDCLPGISGIAKYFKSKFETPYLAGHWDSEDFLESLFWFSRADPPRRIDLDRKRARGPSWSWVSVEGGFKQQEWKDFKKLPGTEILEAFTLLRTSDQTGAVSSGRLRIKGVFLDAKIRNGSGFPKFVIERNRSTTTVFPDHELSIDETETYQTVLCWYVGTATGLHTEEDEFDWIDNAQLIVLRPQAASPQHYERIGRGRVLLEEEELLRGWEQCWSTVTVV